MLAGIVLKTLASPHHFTTRGILCPLEGIVSGYYTEHLTVDHSGSIWSATLAPR